MTYFAKSPRNDGAQETVRQHLAAVADLANRFGQAFDQGPRPGCPASQEDWFHAAP